MTSTPAQAPTRNCVSCGRSISWDANVCPYCGHDYRVVMAGAPPQKKESAMPVIGGILILIVGIAYLGIGGLIAAAGGSVLWMDMEGSEFAVACGAIVLLLGVLVLLGGIFAIQRRHFGLALVAGIFALPSVLGIIGLILIIVSREEFR
ncbi:MAG: zinc ribbon domain-containing protein [Candidatus Thermoplasmatota archaeon]